ncbi:MAG TPA: hypothetical protein VFI95_14645 [Terriglobales bacterium]|nr:hypothetical protein [Terriglobales bacterium]
MNLKSFLLCLALLAFAFSSSLAQDSSSDTNSKSKTRTVTGCLSKGDNSANSNEYLLTGNDGSTWEVRSDNVSLAKHVGHTVTATGVVSHNTMHNMKEDTKDMAHDTGMKKNNSEHGHMTITDLQHVSDSCQK